MKVYLHYLYNGLLTLGVAGRAADRPLHYVSVCRSSPDGRISAKNLKRERWTLAWIGSVRAARE